MKLTKLVDLFILDEICNTLATWMYHKTKCGVFFLSGLFGFVAAMCSAGKSAARNETLSGEVLRMYTQYEDFFIISPYMQSVILNLYNTLRIFEQGEVFLVALGAAVFPVIAWWQVCRLAKKGEGNPLRTNVWWRYSRYISLWFVAISLVLEFFGTTWLYYSLSFFFQIAILLSLYIVCADITEEPPLDAVLPSAS
jgi:hypothetical protein